MSRIGACGPAEALVAATGAELVFNRIGARLLLAPLPADVAAAVDLLGLLSFHLAGTLGAMVAALAAVGLAIDRRRLPPAAHAALVAIAAAPVPLAAFALLSRLPPPLQPTLVAAFALSVAALAAAAAAGPAPGRQRLAVVALGVPVLAQAVWLLSQQAPAVGEALGAAAPALRRAGQWVALSGGAIAFLLLLPAPAGRPRPPPRAYLAGGGAAAAVAVAASLAPAGLAHAAFWGLGLDLPSGGGGLALVLLNVFLFFAAAATLLSGRVRERVLGAGLVLLAMSGMLCELPHQMLATLAAFVLLLRGATWPLPAVRPLSPERWSAWAEACADRLEAEPPIVVRDGVTEVTRLRRGSGPPVDARIVRRNGRVVEVQVAVGSPPADAPEATVLRRGTPRGAGRPAAGPRARTGEAWIDRLCSVRGRADLALRALGELPADGGRHLRGWLGMWEGQGVRYRALPERAGEPERPVPVSEISFLADDAPPPVEELAELVEWLEEVAASVGAR